MKLSLSSFSRTAALAFAVVGISAISAEAVVILNTDFTTGTSGVTFDNPNAGNTASFDTTGPGGSRAISLIDTLNTSGSAGNASVSRFSTSTVFNTGSAGQSELQLRFDIAVTSLQSAANSAALPRFILRNTTDNAQGLTIGLGRSTAGNVMLFAGRGDSITPDNGIAAGNLSYNFGAYDTSVFTNNDTNGYITVSISLLHGGTTMNVLAVQGTTTLFDGVVTGFTSNAFANGNTNLIMATGQGGTSSLFVDNIFLQTIPEPSSMLFGLLAISTLLRRKR